ncbi:TenA family protein [Frigoribacterium sp. VKM Ac-1396]|uniref:TenA family protein n=1 Tax=Frigoribacterium sp. VKM Ac-1396 TaxID=2783821 RepID=UPI00188A349E|nr:TenA family protein [Frigoribacterium sp. VKM Ac-1396]
MADQPLTPAGPSAGRAGRAAALVARCSGELDASAAVPLLARMADGTVVDADFGRYLAIEQAFVRTAARLAGYCLWQQPEWSRAERHAAAVADLVGPQSRYFERLLATRPVDEATLGNLLRRASVLEATVTAALDEGGYAGVVTSLAAAETLYLHWCTQAAGQSVARPADVQEWIDLHVTGSFREQVGSLHQLVDELPADVTDAQLDRWFVAMLRAEDAFHASALDEVAA